MNNVIIYRLVVKFYLILLPSFLIGQSYNVKFKFINCNDTHKEGSSYVTIKDKYGNLIDSLSILKKSSTNRLIYTHRKRFTSNVINTDTIIVYYRDLFGIRRNQLFPLNSNNTEISLCLDSLNYSLYEDYEFLDSLLRYQNEIVLISKEFYENYGVLNSVIRLTKENDDFYIQICFVCYDDTMNLEDIKYTHKYEISRSEYLCVNKVFIELFNYNLVTMNFPSEYFIYGADTVYSIRVSHDFLFASRLIKLFVK